jgi:hypothetical protein
MTDAQRHELRKLAKKNPEEMLKQVL